MSRLAETQQRFQSFMLEADPAISSQVVGTAKVGAQRRLSIYFDGYRARLTEALASNYPALSELLGAEDFEALSGRYIDKHASTFASIRHYGAQLAQFLASEPDFARVPVLADLARWEWALTETFDAADADPVGAQSFASIAPDAWAQLRFECHPSVRQMTLEWNAPQIWKALTDGETPPEVAYSAVPVPWLLWRQDLGTYFRSLPADEAEMLEGARAGRSFGDLCSRLSATWGEATAAQAATYLRTWVESGLITAVR